VTSRLYVVAQPRRCNSGLSFWGDRVLGRGDCRERCLTLIPSRDRKATGPAVQRAGTQRSLCGGAFAEIDMGACAQARSSEDAIRRSAQAGICWATRSEAIIAGLSIVDGGFDESRALILRLWGRAGYSAGQARRPAKCQTALQEWAQARLALPPPAYVQTDRQGPDHALCDHHWPVLKAGPARLRRPFRKRSGRTGRLPSALGPN